MASNSAEGSRLTDEKYFRSYSNVGVHELMIKDKPRTLAYKEFIEKNASIFKGKVVLDVGAGTGILSLFAARCEARKVYAVEASDIADLCREIVKVNLYQDVIEVVKGEIEKVDLAEKVDIIISEWMGFYLLHESMLESVLFARDKWLSEDGIILPSHAGIYACPVNMTDYCLDNIECWEDMYDFDFTPIMQQKVAAHLQQPAVVHLKKSQLLSDSALVAKFDLKQMSVSEIEEIDEQMSFIINKDAELHGFAVWFDTRFTPDQTVEQYGLTFMEKVQFEESEGGSDKIGRTVSDKNDNSCNEKNILQNSDQCQVLNGTSKDCCKSRESSCSCLSSVLHHVTLSTSPSDPETHWKQTVCFLPASLTVRESDTVYCRVTLSQDTSNRRHYNISLEMLEELQLSDTEESLDDDEDAEHHPVPCDCGAGRCTLIRAIMERYDAEQTELEMEAEYTDVCAEIQAAQTLDSEADLSLKDDSYTNNEKQEEAK